MAASPNMRNGGTRDVKDEAVAIQATVRQQVAAGIDMINDGEMSKISYATYIKHRLTGFSHMFSTLTFTATPPSNVSEKPLPLGLV